MSTFGEWPATRGRADYGGRCVGRRVWRLGPPPATVDTTRSKNGPPQTP